MDDQETAALSKLLFEAQELIEMFADVVEHQSGQPDPWSRSMVKQIVEYRAARGWSPNGFGGEKAPQPEPEPKKEPCPEGFHWIGQSFKHCDECGLPAWEHEGMAVGAMKSPFDQVPFMLRPWKPGEREGIQRRWSS